MSEKVARYTYSMYYTWYILPEKKCELRKWKALISFYFGRHADAPSWTKSGLGEDALTWNGLSGHSNSQCLGPCCVLMCCYSLQGMTLGLNRKLLLTPLPDHHLSSHLGKNPLEIMMKIRNSKKTQTFIYSLKCV